MGNFSKNFCNATMLSMAVWVSFVLIEASDAYENPTPAGAYKYMMLALLFQAYSFRYMLVVPGLNKNGLFSVTIPMSEEHPGPPFSQRTTGSLAGFYWLYLSHILPFKKYIIERLSVVGDVKVACVYFMIVFLREYRDALDIYQILLALCRYCRC